MFCKKCGAEIRAKAKFCAKCGTPVPTPAPKEPTDDSVKTLYKRDGSSGTDTHVTGEKTDEGSKLIVTTGEMKESSCNGQFDEWFSEPGDL